MSIQEVKLTLEDLKNIVKKFNLTIEILTKLYCRNEKLHDKILDRVIEFENYLFEKYGIKNVDEFISEILCKEIEVDKLKKEVVIEKPEIKHELIFEIPIYVNGELHKISIVKKGSSIEIESSEVNLCKKPEDILIGTTTIYIKCNDTWYTFVHKLNQENVNLLKKILS